MASVFEQLASSDPNIVDTTKKINGKSSISPFQQLAQEIGDESFGKSALRTALQVPQGLAEGTPLGVAASTWQLLGMGEVNDPEELDRLKAISEREGIPFDEEAYAQAGEEALKYVPTVSNVAREIESKTGVPLEPKNRLQKGLRFASTATKLAPKDYTLRPLNTSLPRPVLGAGVEATKELIQEAGVPEPIADIASFAVLKKPTEGAGKFSIGPVKKPSGLTAQRYEKLTQPTEVSAKRIQKINEKTEGEFRNISNKILDESPISETYNALKEDVTFKQKSAEAFEDVSKLADSLPEKFQTQNLKEQILERVKNKKSSGLTPSEFDKEHRDFIKGFIKETKKKEFTASDLVSQYRKNNKGLTEAFEPGKSFAYNNAKREALLDYNRTIADMIEKQYPNSEFSKLFKETNKRWAEISDAESIDKFLDSLFEGKIQYKKGREFFDKQGMTVPFKRAMGKEGFAKFETLMSDLMSTEQANKLLKQAKTLGMENIVKTAGSYLLHPSIAKAKLGLDFAKGIYKASFEMLLDKPQMAVTWDRGVNAMKAGNFKAAEKEFNTIKAETKSFTERDQKRLEALKKFNEQKKNAKPTDKTINVKSDTIQPKAEDLSSIGAGIAKGMMDNFYEGIFKSLKDGKSTFAGVKDSLITASKPSFDAGLIKNVEDLKRFAESLKKNQSKKT